MKLDRQTKIDIIKGLQYRLDVLRPEYGPYLMMCDIAEVLCYAVYSRPYHSGKYPELSREQKVYLNNIYLNLVKKGLLTKSRTGKTLRVSKKILDWKEMKPEKKFLVQSILFDDNGQETIIESIKTDNYTKTIDLLMQRHKHSNKYVYIAMQINDQNVIYKIRENKYFK